MKIIKAEEIADPYDRAAAHLVNAETYGRRARVAMRVAIVALVLSVLAGIVAVVLAVTG